MALRLRVLELEECRKLQCLGGDFVASRVWHILYVRCDFVGVVELHDGIHDSPKLVLDGVELYVPGATENPAALALCGKSSP